MSSYRDNSGRKVNTLWLLLSTIATFVILGLPAVTGVLVVGNSITMDIIATATTTTTTTTDLNVIDENNNDDSNDDNDNNNNNDHFTTTTRSRVIHTIQDVDLKYVYWLCSDNITIPDTTYLDIVNHTCENTPQTWAWMKADINESRNSKENAVRFPFPRLPTEPGITASYDPSITPYLNLTINSMGRWDAEGNFYGGPGKVLNFELEFDTDGDGIPETSALFPTYTTTQPNATNQQLHRQVEELIELESTGWSAGPPGDMQDGRITLLVWRTDNIQDDDIPQTPDLIIYCGFDHTSDLYPKQSWVLVPFKHKLQRPTAHAGPDENDNGIHDGCEGYDPVTGEPNKLEANYSIEFNAEGSIDPQDDLDDDGVLDPDEPDHLSYEWHFGDPHCPISENFGYGKIVSHIYKVPGTYTVRLTVEDPDGYTDTDYLEVIISPFTGTPPEIEHVFITTCPVFDRVEITETREATGLVDYQILVEGKATDAETRPLYSWDWGDGSGPSEPLPSGHPHFGERQTHTYTTAGTYTLQLIVYDEDLIQHSVEWSATLHITENKAPVAVIRAYTPDYPDWQLDNITAVLGQDIIFDASLSYDPDNMPGFELDCYLQYLWEFGDGTSSGWLTNATYTHNYTFAPASLTFEVKLTVKDGSELTATDTFLVMINLPPVADAGPDLPLEGEEIVVGQTIEFDASDSYDPNNDPLFYYWDFGDNTTATGITVTHSYNAPGIYTVTLRVTDGVLESTDTCEVEVLPVNELPIAKIKVYVEGKEVKDPSKVSILSLTEIKLSAFASNDPDGWLTACTWQLIEEEVVINRSLEEHGYEFLNITYIFKRAGTYEIVVKVCDNRNGWSEPFSITLSIKNRLPIADAGSDREEPYKNRFITLDGSNSSDPDGWIVNWTWIIETPKGDVFYVYGEFREFEFKWAGEYHVRLVVRDNDGGEAEDSIKIEIKKVKKKPKPTPDFEFISVIGLFFVLVAISIVAHRLKKKP